LYCKTFSAVFTHVTNMCWKFRSNLSTRYSDITLRAEYSWPCYGGDLWPL